MFQDKCQDVYQDICIKDDLVLLPWVCIPDQDQDMEERDMLRVLKRAATDDDFIARLTYEGEQVLQGYHLSWQAKAALLSGDIRWVENRVGKLNPEQRTWFDCRLQQEIW